MRHVVAALTLGLLPLAIGACGPGVSPPAQSSSSSSTTSGDTTSTSTSSSDTSVDETATPDTTGEPEPTHWCVVSRPIALGDEASFAKITDVDGDGEPELWTPTEDGIQITRPGASEAMDESWVIPLDGAELRDVDDIDGDGVVDILMVSPRWEFLWLRGLGDGNFEPSPDFITGFGEAPRAVYRDVTADGQTDIVTIGPNIGAMAIYVGDGTGHFDFAWNHEFDARNSIGADNRLMPLESWSHFIMHVALSCSSCSEDIAHTVIASGQPDGSLFFEQEHIGPINTILGSTDLDGDGALDVIVSERTGSATHDLVVLTQPGGAPDRVVLDSEVRFIREYDVDGDGVLDLWFRDSETGDQSVRHWEGDDFSPPRPISGVWELPLNATHYDYEQRDGWTDLDGDGWTDFVSRSSSGHALWHLEPCVP